MSRVTQVTFGRHAEVSAVLADPRFAVATPADEGGPIGWLRSQVSRFSTGATHQRRRALSTAVLHRIPPGDLRRAAYQAALGGLSLDEVARTVPVRVLAEAIGVRAPVTAEIAVVARGYQPGTEAGPEAAPAMAHLVQACGGAWDERTAARIGLLVQTFDATAGLIVNAAAALRRWQPSCLVAALLLETLRYDPPVPVQRRVCLTGAVVGDTAVAAGWRVHLDVAAANRDPAVFADPDRFDPARAEAAQQLTLGAGLRPCPGRDHAFAIATGVVETLVPGAVSGMDTLGVQEEQR